MCSRAGSLADTKRSAEALRRSRRNRRSPRCSSWPWSGLLHPKRMGYASVPVPMRLLRRRDLSAVDSRPDQTLQGAHVLIVEDEYYIADDLARALLSW